MKSRLGEWDELPVPRNFYLYDDPQTAPQLPPKGSWMPVAALLFVLMMGAALFWGNVQLTYGEGFVAVSFGEGKINTPPFTSDQVSPAVKVPDERDEILKRLVQESVMEILSGREERWNDQLSEALSMMDSRLEKISAMQARIERVSEMEQRLTERIVDETEELKVDLESSMASLYEALKWQYQRDLYSVIAQTNRLALAEMQQSRRTDALASALVTLADVQVSYPAESAIMGREK